MVDVTKLAALQNNKDVFTTIYTDKMWMPDRFAESISGTGSSLRNTVNFRKELSSFIVDNEIKSVLDLGCGDVNCVKEFFPLLDNYTGVDIVEELITSLQEKYPDQHFECSDVLDYEIKQEYDLIIVKDVFIHLRNEQIKTVLGKIKSSNAKYFVTTSFSNYITNIDLDIIGWWRPINLLIDPFNLKPFLAKTIAETNVLYEFDKLKRRDKTFVIFKLK